jgi:hypothetical protein
VIAEALTSALMGFSLIGLGLAQTDSSSENEEPPRMTQDLLESRLDDSKLTIIDLRQPGEWESADVKIKGAVRENPQDVESWADKYSKDQELVLYCS